MATKVAINGFGRIGMLAAKVIAGRDDLELVAINATGAPDQIEYLLKYDSVHGRFDGVKLIDDKTIKIGKNTVKINSTRDPAEADFGAATVLIECTGKFLTKEKAAAHLRGNIKKVVLSAPAKDDTPTYVIGVNHTQYKGETIISNASCTTNCLAPLAKVLHEAFGIENGLMTTVHSYTNDQNILDVKHPADRRRARAAAVNMIPTTTGAAKAVGLVLPELAGKLNGFSIRVPTPDVSVVDLTVNLKKGVTKDQVNDAVRAAANGAFKGLIIVDEDKCVSSDFIGCPASTIYVPDTTQVVGEKLVKVLAWYDNEWGYTNRLIDMTAFVAAN
ncbi:glyceraldehyde-3-phosphate dehydrogenase [Campylobacterota bacterium]|nr:glyceraldehyde-3-phosphate dehydrogenase [Campylobacterota bacterium]